MGLQSPRLGHLRKIGITHARIYKHTGTQRIYMHTVRIIICKDDIDV